MENDGKWWENGGNGCKMVEIVDFVTLGTHFTDLVARLQYDGRLESIVKWVLVYSPH